MKKTISITERIACMIIGSALLVVGLVFIALGVTFFPVVGIVAALPVIGLASFFFRPGKWAVSSATEVKPAIEPAPEFGGTAAASASSYS